MFWLYDKHGTKHKFNYQIDAKEAVKSGHFFEKDPFAEEVKPEGENPSVLSEEVKRKKGRPSASSVEKSDE